MVEIVKDACLQVASNVCVELSCKFDYAKTIVALGMCTYNLGYVKRLLSLILIPHLVEIKFAFCVEKPKEMGHYSSTTSRCKVV